MKQPVLTIYQPEFWEEQWKSLNAVPTAFSGYGSKETWNSMARDYGRNRDPEDFEDRIDATLARLEKNGIVFENASVLDVGCGTGCYAAAFARRGARVVALDISEKMLGRLREETASDPSSRITPLIADWKTLDLEGSGYVKAFDLVFANMTPAVTNPASFRKLMRASKRWCWYRSWAGPRKNPLLERLHRAVNGKEPQPFSGNFICAWNLTCASGYFPDCSFETVRWTEKRQIDECIGFYSDYFSGGDGAKKAAITTKIDASLSGITIDGFIENTVTGHTGSMLWALNQ